ncbi:hypothetical protein Harman_15910 [Haloarcula mannanilytica]|uniref:Lipoprotein n=1 Tax=Haloarcula mannanilytica TaxID=2509225 RepID=A0A4C2EGV6_9EURY|nr:hypothetical protein [Haloarcula mannanilytica]GCF13656.1 hypothetical protein Harman_15910 [Haloarcula mannanilytica]
MGAVALAGCSSDQANESGATESDGGGAETPEGSTDEMETDTPTDSGGQPQFGQTARFPESYAMTMTTESEGQTVEMTGRFYEGDMYVTFEQQGQQMELYHIGDTTYTVAGGQCIMGTMQQGMDREDVDPSEFSDRAEQNPDITPVGRETIDGDEVLVYELSQSGTDEPVTYYILADSGYPRRIETGRTRWDFHSWGDVDPIQEPDADCQSMPSGGMTANSGN